MAFDFKYGDVEIPGVPDDEPVFILRAQDVFSVPTIQSYQNHVRQIESDGPPEEWFGRLDDVMTKFVEWQTENKSKVKAPD